MKERGTKREMSTKHVYLANYKKGPKKCATIAEARHTVVDRAQYEITSVMALQVARQNMKTALLAIGFTSGG